ncbi:MAG: cupin domain-containing protein [Polyangiaceae bacterium]
MSTDPLSDVLASVRLHGAIFYYVSFGDEWVAETPASPELARALMPTSEHVLAYHLMLKGGCWAATTGESPVRLSEGDIVMFPRGDAHVMSSAPGMRASRDDSDWRVLTRDDPKPIAVAYYDGRLRPGELASESEVRAVIVCGFVGCDLRPFNPLIGALPRLLHLHAGGVGAWVEPMLHHAVEESRRSRAGSAAMLERVSEMVFVDAARRHLESISVKRARAGSQRSAITTWGRPSSSFMNGQRSPGPWTTWRSASECRARRSTSDSRSWSACLPCNT